MATTRTPLRRNLRRRLTDKAIAAWKAADEMALHQALGLKPWDASPLPIEITPLGVSERLAAWAEVDRPVGWGQTYQQAIELQRELLAAAGPPNCRRAYEENLREAEEMAAYDAELVAHPERGGKGTGCDPESRRASLEAALKRVAYRKKLLDDLGPP